MPVEQVASQRVSVVVQGVAEFAGDVGQGRQTQRSIIWIVASAVWLIAVCVGLFAVSWYIHQPGDRQAALRHWPSDSPIPLSADRATLVLFAHPRCPCTRVTLGELEKIVARCQDKVTPWIVFFEPHRAADDWHTTDQWQSAVNIPGAHVLDDPGGESASRFHAVTSGQVLLYNPRGELVFRGGITGARGHAGDNAGANAVCAYLLRGALPVDETPVFGCPLVSPSATN
jgi:hypothetical protein